MALANVKKKKQKNAQDKSRRTRRDEGSIIQRNGKVYARIQYTDASGKRRAAWRVAENVSDAKVRIRELKAKLLGSGEQALDGDRMLFHQLAADYSRRKLIPAEYHGERKIAGLRSYKPLEGYIRTLTTYFGRKLIRAITHADLEAFKRARLKEPVYRKKRNKAGEWMLVKREEPRTIASVNRELELMRAVLRHAYRQGWLARSPFEMGSPVISKADETRRERVLSQDEEKRLLAACQERRTHLRPILIAALDTAMRRGELFKLKWGDVDLENQTINVLAMNSKTARGRQVGVTLRLKRELEGLWNLSPKDLNELVFGIEDTVKNSFAAACKAAKIKGFRFHDCRHTAITRMIAAGVQPIEAMKVSGHTQMTTFTRYVNPNQQAVRRAAELLGSYNSETGKQSVVAR